MAKRKIPAGVKDAVAALALEGKTPTKEIARRFGLDPQTVRRWVSDLRDLDPATLAELQRGLPKMLQLVAAAHTQKALEKIDDPNASVRHTFGAKLAVEAGRVAQPGAEAPGHTVLNFINQLNVATRPPEVIEAHAVHREAPVPQLGDGSAAGSPVADRRDLPLDGVGVGAGHESEALVGELVAAPGGAGGGDEAGGRPDDAGAAGWAGDGGDAGGVWEAAPGGVEGAGE